jgi:hypothetical protein
MREKTNAACLVPAIVIVFLCGCVAPAVKVQPAPASVIPADTRAKLEQEAAERTKAEKDAFDLLTERMDEYQDTMALCDSMSKGNQDSRMGTVCGEKLKRLKEEIGYLSGLLKGGQ